MTLEVESVDIKSVLRVGLNLKTSTGSIVLDSSVHVLELPSWTRLSPQRQQQQQQEGTPCILSSSNIHPAAPRCFSGRRRATASGTEGEPRPGGRNVLLTRDRKKSPAPKRHGCSFLLPPPRRCPQLLPRCRRQEIR